MIVLSAMNESAKKNWSTSRQSRRQNVAPGVSPGDSNASDSQPSKGAAEDLSPLAGLKRFLSFHPRAYARGYTLPPSAMAR